ncbi:MAG: tyrosine-type recombinase/integrase, partial [Plesiomonas shigelloides]
RRISTGATAFDDAKAFLRNWLEDLYKPQNVMTVEEANEYYLTIQRRKAKVSVANIANCLKRVNEHMGQLMIAGITPATISDYAETRLTEIRSKLRTPRPNSGHRMVCMELQFFRAALRRAEKDGIIPKAPFIELPVANAGVKARFRVLSTLELDKLMAAALDRQATPWHVRCYVQLALLTGQRQRSLLALKWEHITDRYIMFSETQASSNKVRRNLPLTPAIAQVLGECEANRRGDYVLHWLGSRIQQMSALSSLCKRAGVPDVQARDLRRTFATHGANAGGSLEHLALILGNTVAVAEKHYAHHAPELFQPVMNNLQGLVLKNQAPAPAKERKPGGRLKLTRTSSGYLNKTSS